MDECEGTSVDLLDGIQPLGTLSNSHFISCDGADNLETIDCEVASLGLSDDIQPVRISSNSRSYIGRSVQSCNGRL